MFNARPYAAVNREERFYCALFAHALLMSRTARERFARIAEGRLGVVLDVDCMEVFVEAAALRDYWRDLGDPVAYTGETHEARRRVVDAVLREMDLDDAIVDDLDLFWTSGLQSKLWTPGRWSIQKLKAAGLEALIPAKWSFNAKPDLMIVSPGAGILIEAKVESGEGRDGATGYGQFEVQKLVSRLIQRLVPVYERSLIYNTELALRNGAGIAWADVQSMIDTDEIDEFTRKCLNQLVAR